MHSARELTSSSFEIRVAGREVRLVDLFEGFDERDRLGVVIGRPGGGLGASALITATITAFYDLQRARGPDFFIYPDYYLFHVGKPFGDHSRLDIWPAHKEVVVPGDPSEVLRAVNDRAITRLVVEEGEPSDRELGAEELASARARIATCLAYSASGRVANADVRIASNAVVEGYVDTTLDPERRAQELRARGAGERADEIAARADEIPSEQRGDIERARETLVDGGVPVETYRRIGLDEALAQLVTSRP
jgi:hypothetical protein